MSHDNGRRIDTALSRAVIVFGVLLAFGLVAGAYVLGAQTKNIGSQRSTVTVKGLAEKPIAADIAEWRVSATAHGATFAEALAKLRKEKAALDQFLESQGFAVESRRDQEEHVSPHFEDRVEQDRIIQVQKGFDASQAVLVSGTSLTRIAKASKAALDYKAAGNAIRFDSPNYLVSNLEEIKMSLIAAATENARRRAEEFIKSGKARLGSIRSASQGAFYILADTTDARADDYGGVYDKSTVDKVARVVVTVEFNIE